MKKHLFTILFALFAVFSSHAEKTIVHTLNFSVPIERQTWEDEGYSDNPSFWGISFNWNMLTVHKSGYSFILGLGHGGTGGKWHNDTYGDVDPFGLDSNFKLGLGFAPLQNEKMILAFHGFWGFSTKIMFATDISYRETGTDGRDRNSDFLIFDFTNVIGFDAVFAMKLSDVFGIMAGIDVSTNFIGGVIYTESDSGSDFSDDIWGFGVPFGKVNVVPRFGICWILE